MVGALAVLVGILIGLSAYLLLALTLVGISGLAILRWPRLSVWVSVVGALCVSGLVELYAPGLQQVRWVFAALSITLVVIAGVQRLSVERTRADRGATYLLIALGFMPVAALMGALAGQMSIPGVIVGMKNYFQMWGLIVALAWLGYKPIDAARFIRFLALLSLIQLPFVLHQFFYLVPLRNTREAAEKFIVAVDVVAGTFGGDLYGGGRSSDLALLVGLAVVYFFAQAKHRVISLSRALMLSLLAFVPILFNEAKLALVLLPFGLFVLHRRTILQRPFMAMLMTMLVTGLMAVLLIVYSMLPGERGRSFEAFVDEAIAYNVGSKGYGSAVLNRSTVYSFWWTEHYSRGDFRSMVFGHGPGASNPAAGSGQITLAARRYAGYAIGLTSVSSLLWDMGLLGTVGFLLVFLLAQRLAVRLRREWGGTSHEATLEAVQIGLLMTGITLLHSNYLAFDVGFQTLFALQVGYLLALSHRRPEVGQ
jgi:hypothetical protein